MTCDVVSSIFGHVDTSVSLSRTTITTEVSALHADTHLDTLRSAAFVDTRLKLRRGDLGRTRRADIIRRSIRHIRSDVPGIRAADRDLSHYGTYPFDGILSTGRLRIHRSRHYNDRRRYFSVGDLQDNQIDRLTAGLGRCRLET